MFKLKIKNNQLSKNEHKYRNKIIQKYHLKKEEQKRLSIYAGYNTYKKLYECPFLLPSSITKEGLTVFLKEKCGIDIHDNGHLKSLKEITDEIIEMYKI